MKGIVFPKKKMLSSVFGKSKKPTFLTERSLTLDVYFQRVAQLDAIEPILGLQSFLARERRKILEAETEKIPKKIIGSGFENIQALQSHSGKFTSIDSLQTSRWTCCGNIFKNSKWCGVLSVPECCETIEQAVDIVKNSTGYVIHTIVLGIGIHVIKKDYITIDQPLKIVGMDEIDTVVTGGGFQIRGDKNVTLPSMVVELKHFTVKKSPNIGICNFGGLPLLMKDVRLIECGGHGIAIRESKAHLKDVQVTKCAMMGITISNGANLTLSGEETLIAGNCTTSMARHYGLHAAGAASIVRVLDSLVLENVVKNNGGGGNFGSQSGGVVGVGVVSRNSIVVAENEVDVVVEVVEKETKVHIKTKDKEKEPSVTVEKLPPTPRPPPPTYPHPKEVHTRGSSGWADKRDEDGGGGDQ